MGKTRIIVKIIRLFLFRNLSSERQVKARNPDATEAAGFITRIVRWPETGGHRRIAFRQLKTFVVSVQGCLATENSVSSNADPSRLHRAGHNPRGICL